jgi:pimeloyl-ACP methyl ester carboxylesterase
MRMRMGISAAIALTAVAACLASGAAPATADSSPAVSVLSEPVQFASVSGATLGYRIAGTGRPLMLIAGSSNTMAEWDPRMLDQLAQSRQIIVFDNRGAGTSTGSVAHLTIALMARDTAQLLTRLAPDGADVLGWSMGGYIAQELAIRAPSRVRRLILASTDCGGPSTIPPTATALRTLTNPHATANERMAILFPTDQMAAAWPAAIGVAYSQSNFRPGTLRGRRQWLAPRTRPPARSGWARAAAPAPASAGLHSRP